MTKNSRTSAAHENTVVIAGATGTIGRALIHTLSASGYSIIVLTRHTHAAGLNAISNVHCISWDAKNSGQWETSINGAQAVINLAGASLVSHRLTAAYKARCISSRIDSTRAIVAAIHRATKKPEVFINASAAGYYGYDRISDETHTESSPPGNDFFGTLCTAWEHEAAACSVRTVMMRTGFVLDENGGLRLLAFAARLFGGGIILPGNQWQSWIHIDDVTGIIKHVLGDRNISGPVNAVSPSPVTEREFQHTLCRLLRRPSWIIKPAWLMRLLMGEASRLMTHGTRVLPERITSHGYRFLYPLLENALRDILHS
ncbi:MAG: TIGR01777 family protein [Spirochaetes bacterium]|nr:TIGR01777 family protein [Spirochaetota bacterium]